MTHSYKVVRWQFNDVEFVNSCKAHDGVALPFSNMASKGLLGDFIGTSKYWASRSKSLVMYKHLFGTSPGGLFPTL